MQLVFEEIGLDGIPIILDVCSSSPRIACVWTPSKDSLFTPVAERVEDFSFRSPQSISHLWVSDISWNVLIVAIVVLQVVNSPVREVLRINLFMEQTSSSARTCQ